MEFPEGVAMVRLTRIVKPRDRDRSRRPGPQVEKEVRNAKKLELQTARAAKVAAELNRLADAKKIEDYLKKENLKIRKRHLPAGKPPGRPARDAGTGRRRLRHGARTPIRSRWR